jgi:hypothetical protein
MKHLGSIDVHKSSPRSRYNTNPSPTDFRQIKFRKLEVSRLTGHPCWVRPWKLIPWPHKAINMRKANSFSTDEKKLPILLGTPTFNHFIRRRTHSLKYSDIVLFIELFLLKQIRVLNWTKILSLTKNDRFWLKFFSTTLTIYVNEINSVFHLILLLI